MKEKDKSVRDILFQIRFKPWLYEELGKKAEASGLDRGSYIKLLISKIGIEAVVGGRLFRDRRLWRRMYKEEKEGLGVAEGHALKALSGSYDPILAVNELWIYNKGWVRQLVLQYCDQYGMRQEEFGFTKTIAKVIIRAYFEIEDIVPRKRGYTRGRYKLRPEYTARDVSNLEKRIYINDARTFDRLLKKWDKEDASIEPEA